MGKRDADGFLSIIDRKKHILITAGGKNLTPGNIENAIKAPDPILSQVHVHGDRRAYVTTIVSVGPIEAIEWARSPGFEGEDYGGAPEAWERMKRERLTKPLARPMASTP